MFKKIAMDRYGFAWALIGSAVTWAIVAIAFMNYYPRDNKIPYNVPFIALELLIGISILVAKTEGSVKPHS
jgi:hypothetical protein